MPTSNLAWANDGSALSITAARQYSLEAKSQSGGFQPAKTIVKAGRSVSIKSRYALRILALNR